MSGWIARNWWLAVIVIWLIFADRIEPFKSRWWLSAVVLVALAIVAGIVEKVIRKGTAR